MYSLKELDAEVKSKYFVDLNQFDKDLKPMDDTQIWFDMRMKVKGVEALDNQELIMGWLEDRRF